MNRQPLILIVDKEDSFRNGFRDLIDLNFGLIYRVEAISADELKHYEECSGAKLIIIGYLPKHPSFINMLKLAKQKGSKIVLMVLNSAEIPSLIDLKLFDGFLLKNMPTLQIINVLTSILKNQGYVHPTIGYQLIQKIF